MARATNIEIQFENHQINLKIGKKKMTLYSQEQKEIKGSDLIEIFDYKKGKKYIIKELKVPEMDITQDEKKYLQEYYNVIESIVDKL